MRANNEIREGSAVGQKRAEMPGGGLIEELRSEIGRLRDELVRAEWRIAELEAHADIDPLLDIFNRRGFERELRRALAYARRYSIPGAMMFIDLDGFKAVNDAYGHAIGDRLLKAVARQLAAHVRASDIVARLGGDEFAVLMWHIRETEAEAKARELEKVIEEAGIVHDETRLSVGASAGTVPLSVAHDPAAIVDAADRAMYARKKERRR